ncbi:hypothetical protein [Dyadobacter luticola]|uniref:Uncharacterized protein n=1 Tax=Dyadobacter luticola TaxID=1979387 RepID=A0A5R9L4Y4_9BACT|nr:hypothetical protein [Dyadobacter luticola]TLV03335.1 hypothetical protein FEN17_06905 [Dyadobacter luticola]
MKHEKEVTLETGRTIKIILSEAVRPNNHEVMLDLDVLIRDPKDEDFHPPIEQTHPKYWKLKSMDSEKSRQMQIKYSGITDKLIRKAIKEFRQN